MKGKRAAALLLVMIFLMQSAWAAFAAPNETDAVKEDLNGEVLIAVNTDTKDRDAWLTAACDEARAAQQTDTQAVKRPQGRTTLLDKVYDDVQVLSPAQAAKKEAAYGDNIPQAAPAEYHVGDQKTIYIDNHSSQDTCLVTCCYVGKECTVWTQYEGEDAVNDAVEIGQLADEMIPQELELLGDKRIDTDRDGKIAIFFHDMGGGLGGYFSAWDLVDRSGRIGNVWVAMPAQNACDCIHINYVDRAVIVHEYQHYINFSYGFAGKNNFNFLLWTESYITEGFSTSAAVILSDESAEHYVYNFEYAMAHPEKYSLLYWTQCSESYALSFVFSQYLRTRYAQLTHDTATEYPGKGVYKKIMESRTVTTARDTLGVAADLLYPQSAYPQLKTTQARSKQLLTDFWLAVYYNNAEGSHGFSGESWAEDISVMYAIKDSLPTEKKDAVRSGMAAFYVVNDYRPGNVRVRKSSDRLRTMTVNGSFYTVTYDLNGIAADVDVELASEHVFAGQTICTRQDFGLINRERELYVAGWAEDPSAEIGYGEFCPTEDTTLYAVWKPIEQFGEGETAFSIDEGAGYKAFYFVPECDGYYTFISSNSETSEDFYLYTEDAEHCYYDWKEETYYLTAGKKYYYEIRSWYFQEGKITITHEQNVYTLTLYEDPDTVYTLVGRDHYAPAIALGLDAWRNDGRVLLGWSAQEGAQTPEYKLWETVELQEDMTLYAVWKLPYFLDLEKEMTVSFDEENGEHNFMFITPPDDGLYQIECTFDRECELNNGSLWIYCPSTESWARYEYDLPEGAILQPLLGCRKYIILVNVWEEVSMRIRITRVGDAAFTLRYVTDVDIPFRIDPIPIVNESGKCEYTIIDYVPHSAFGNEFLGWTINGNEIYTAGDTIELYEDTVLHAVWDSDREENEIQVRKNPIKVGIKLLKALLREGFRIIRWYRAYLRQG